MIRPNTPLESALAWEAAEDRMILARVKRNARRSIVRKLARVVRSLALVLA